MLRPTLVMLVLVASCTSTTAPAPTPTKTAPESKTDAKTPEAKTEPKAPGDSKTPEPKTPDAKAPGSKHADDGTAPSDTALPPTANDQWACSKDADCVQTCALGAVSGAWLERNRDADDCDDGCGWKSGQQACRDGECVTLTAEGDVDDTCTKRVPRPRP